MAKRYNGGGWYSPHNGFQMPQSSSGGGPLGQVMQASQQFPQGQDFDQDDNQTMNRQSNPSWMTKMKANKYSDKKANSLKSLSRYQLQMCGVLLCLLAAFSFGLSLSNSLLVVLSYADLACLAVSPILPGIPALNSLSHLFHSIPNFPPAFVIIVSVFCLVVKRSKGSLIKYLFILTLVNMFMFMPVFMLFGILGILHALSCQTGAIPLFKLVIPILIVLFAFLLSCVLLYLITVLRRIRKNNSKFSRKSALSPVNSQKFRGGPPSDMGQYDYDNALPSFGISPFNMPMTYYTTPMAAMPRYF